MYWFEMWLQNNVVKLETPTPPLKLVNIITWGSKKVFFLNFFLINFSDSNLETLDSIEFWKILFVYVLYIEYSIEVNWVQLANIAIITSLILDIFVCFIRDKN